MIPTLPDEILIKIIKDCVSDIVSVTRIHISKKYWRSGYPGKPKYGLVYKGLPKVMNFLLVNSLFYEETWGAVVKKFHNVSWKVDFECIPLLTQKLRAESNLYDWLKYNMHYVTICKYRTSSAESDLKSFLDPESTPNLRGIVLLDAAAFSVDIVLLTTAMPPGHHGPQQGSTADEIHERLFGKAGLTSTLQARRILLLLNIIRPDGASAWFDALTLQGRPGTNSNKYEISRAKTYFLNDRCFASWLETSEAELRRRACL